MREFVIIGPRRRVQRFKASSITSFRELRRNIQGLFRIYSLVEFDVYREEDVQSGNKAKKSGFSLAGLELNEVGWGSCTTPDKLRGNRHHYFDLRCGVCCRCACIQARWKAHLQSLSPTTAACVEVKAKGKPFSAYSGLSGDELQ